MSKQSFYVDTGAIQKELQQYFKKEFERVCDIMVSYIQSEIPMERNVPYGKFEWRKEVREAFQTLSVSVANNTVSGKIGQPYMQDSREYIIAMIIDKGHSGPIFTRPGEEVYDDDMYLRESSALVTREIPQFYQEGSDFMENAKKRMRLRFDLEMEAIFSNIPKKIFSRNMRFE